MLSRFTFWSGNRKERDEEEETEEREEKKEEMRSRTVKKEDGLTVNFGRYGRTYGAITTSQRERS